MAPTVGQRGECAVCKHWALLLHGQHNLVQGTPDSLWVGPILWRALVTRGRRNARKGVGHSVLKKEWLKVRANPSG